MYRKIVINVCNKKCIFVKTYVFFTTFLIAFMIELIKKQLVCLANISPSLLNSARQKLTVHKAKEWEEEGEREREREVTIVWRMLSNREQGG